jgi:hypothetical protein
MFAIRFLIHTTAMVLLVLGALGCDLSSEEALADDPDPPYQDLDAGDDWPTDTDTDEEGETIEFDPSIIEQEDGGPDSTDDDTDSCLDIGWEGYHVEGSCPDLPSAGAIVQSDDCTFEVPGELGTVIGESGSVSGNYVATDHCTGTAEVGEFPSLTLTCLVEEASCEVGLTGGASGW